MTSQSFFDRFTSSRRASLLPMHSPPQRLPSEYDLDELDPQPDDRLLHETPSREPQRAYDFAKATRRPSPESWNGRASSVGSISKLKARPPRAMFAGPPPPIASSAVLPNARRDRPRGGGSRAASASGRADTRSSILFDHRMGSPTQRPDSKWRGFRRQEKALENDVQQLLDLQAAGLIAGLGGRPPTGSDFDDYSDAGSSTPTGTFYSTATSKSRMVNSIHIPARANADGSVIPVRQPKNARPPGLRAARTGLRKTMLSMASLKMEEGVHIDDALAQRKKALLQVDRLSSRKETVQEQLHSWEEDEEELTGKELRELETNYDSLTQEIHDLEEKLVGMRNRRRTVRAQMEDVRNRREAGLSSYKGTLRDLESDIAATMRHPPVEPLDPDIIDQNSAIAVDGGERINVSVGRDFLRMIPERRTIDMARTWWQVEIGTLEQRKAQIEAEHRALEEGGSLWSEVMTLVTDFESRLRTALKSTSAEASPSLDQSNGKGKEKIRSQEDVIREQLPLLQKSIADLEAHMQTAESRGWNLLICAVGAELEAFKEARDLLHGAVGAGSDEQSPDSDAVTSQQQTDDKRETDGDLQREESEGNEVPDDLLVSGIADDKHEEEQSRDEEHGDIEPGTGSVLRRMDSSDNDVPAEFFAEHDKLD